MNNKTLLQFLSFDALIQFTCASFIYKFEIDQRACVLSGYFTDPEIELAINGFEALVLEIKTTGG